MLGKYYLSMFSVCKCLSVFLFVCFWFEVNAFININAQYGELSFLRQVQFIYQNTFNKRKKAFRQLQNFIGHLVLYHFNINATWTSI